MREVLAALLIGLLAGALAGWKVSNWQHDSQSLAVQQAAQAIRDDALARESAIAQQVQDAFKDGAPVERVIDRGVIREVQKTEYRNVCFGPDLMRLINDGARDRPTGAAGDTAGALPGGSAATSQR